MKDTDEMTCAAFGDVAAELALGTLSGDERARALSHIETCVECRRETARLADTVEELLVLAPRVEPSPGLEHAVLARIEAANGGARAAGPGPRAGRRRRTAGRVLALAAAVGLVVAALVVAVRPADHAPASRLADMRTESNQVVGSVVLTADPAAAVLDIPHWNALVDSYGAAADAPYWLSLRARDG
ncbi:MAG TPA: hypothetical protein VFX21_12655, partial [Acidimicrobiia bacterium]|nr:hypothetical protein [Acidimicrobiia bacterium]